MCCVPLELTRAASAGEEGIHKEILRSGITTLIISNEEIKKIMKIVRSLKGSFLLTKSVIQTLENEKNEQKGRFLAMLSCTLWASLLRNMDGKYGRYWSTQSWTGFLKPAHVWLILKEK